MSVVEGVTCYGCGKARTADITDGYEAWADGEQQGWICQGCADLFYPGQRFAEAMRRLFPKVGYFHTRRWPDGRLVRGTVLLSWMTP